MANSIVIEGNLTRDPEQSGNGPVKMSIAWNQSVKDKATGEWSKVGHFFDVISWEREKVSGAGLSKGTRVLITGKIHQESWESKEGEKRSKVVIVADRDGIATSLPFVERDTPDW
jgi:single-strand DNA-binding protein